MTALCVQDHWHMPGLREVFASLEPVTDVQVAMQEIGHILPQLLTGRGLRPYLLCIGR
ncbi:MAG: hypothetical protein MUQ27_04735 [Acidimicrobiia bacterium]|nr:hypothetical protein [Acidimicrobiia bacterium]